MERHSTGRMGWLRAAVLGANDGIVSTSSLLLGVAAAHATHGSVLVAGAHKELASIYVARGLDPALARQVAEQLMTHDALGAHARDELGISETLRARPIQAAFASAGSFTVGAAMPLLVTIIAPAGAFTVLLSGTSLVFLAVLGGLAAHVGGAGVIKGTMRVTFWGVLAMALTAAVGALFGAVA